MENVAERGKIAARECWVLLLLVSVLATGCVSSATQEATTGAGSTLQPVSATIPPATATTPVTPTRDSTPTRMLQTATYLPAPQTIEIDFAAIKALPAGEYAKLSDGYDSYVMSISGELTHIAAAARGFGVDDISYDGQTVQVRDGRDVSIYHIYDLMQGETKSYQVEEQYYGQVSPNQKWLPATPGDDFLIHDLDTPGRTVNLSEIVGISASHYTDLHWSPDSKWISVILYFSYREITEYGLYFLDTSCLATPATCKDMFYGPFQPENLQVKFVRLFGWSPDSENVVVGFGGEETQLAIFNWITRKYEFLEVADHLRVSVAKWSPGGQYLFVLSEKAVDGLHRSVYSIDVATHRLTKIYEGPYNLIGVLATYPAPVFAAGNQLTVSGAGKNLRVRTAPSFEGSIVVRLNPGDQVALEEGPLEVGADIWWKVKVVDQDIEGYCLQYEDWYQGE